MGRSRWKTWVDPRTGRTVKSGLSPQSRDYVPPHRLLGVYRAIVLKTYATDAPERTEGSRSTSSRTYEVECDILLTKSLVFYSRVPVLQPSHGVSDANLWIPRETTTTVGSLLPLAPNLTRVSRRGTPVFPLPPNPDSLDGDQVLVQFVEGDVEKPIIVGAMSHASTRRKVIAGSGWSESDFGLTRGTAHRDERYIRYRGVEFRINDAGDVLIDTVGATTDQATETPNPLSGGNVRVRIKPTQRFTIQIEGLPPGSGDAVEVYRDLTAIPTAQVQVDLLEDASQAYVRGTTFAAALGLFLDACITLADAAATQFGALASASEAAPLTPLVPGFSALATAFGAWGTACGVLKAKLVPYTPATPLGVLSTQIRGE